MVSVDVGDVREQLENIPGCVICDDDSVETISKDIRKALVYPFPIVGRELVRDLSWDLISKGTISLYQNCLEEKC